MNDDGSAGTAPDPLVWSAGVLPNRRRIVHAVRNCNSALLGVHPSDVCAEGVHDWPHSVGMLVKWIAFPGTLHSPAASAYLGAGGVSHVALLILCEFWAGESLILDEPLPRYRRLGRRISVSAVPSGPGIDIWRSCR